MNDIFELSDAATDNVAALDPMLATFQGLAGHEHEWPDLSPAGAAAAKQFHVELRDAALDCDVPDARHRLAQRVLVDYCEPRIAQYDSRGYQVELNNIGSFHQTARFIYGSMADQTADDWELIITRLATVRSALAGFRESLEEGRSAGNVVSRRQVEAVIEQGLTAFGEGSSFDSLRERLAQTAVSDEHIETALDNAIDEAKDAFRDFNSYLDTTYLPSASPVDAVGEERYLRDAEMFLGTSLDAREAYRWGWDEVERLSGEMVVACADIDDGASVAHVIADLSTRPEFAAADVDEFIELMQQRQEQALANLAGVHFDVPPQIRTIEVQVEPSGGALAPHYVPPSEDFRRPGSVWYPIEGRSHFPLFSEITTAYHEGFPGHHLQAGVQLSLSDELSRFHRNVVWYPGSGEGWALYAEHLMGELGYLERPEYQIGLLSMQLFRAARVAIDIGVHLELPIPDGVSFHPGELWTFQRAHDLLTTRAFLSDEMARSEVIRYMGWPGQAISYKIGERAILDLRDEWRAAGGFEPKRFHSTVLSAGSVGLDLLREHVRSAM